MKKLTFRQQWWLAVGIILGGFLLATVFKRGIFSNIAWVMSGLLFIINPVIPEFTKSKYGGDDRWMKNTARSAGILVIIIGLITKFGV